MKKIVIVIVGAGPAGLSAAIELARHNLQCVVLEKGKPGQIDEKGDTKLCAGGLIPTSRSFLGKLKSVVFENKNLEAKSIYSKTEISFDYSAVTTIDRDLLARELTQRALKAGAKIMFDTPVLSVDLGRKYITTGNGKIDYDYLIGADGAFSIVRKKLQEKGFIEKDNKFLQAVEYKIDRKLLDRPLLVDFNYRLFSCGYAWIFPHKKYLYIGAAESNITRMRKKRSLLVDLLAWSKKEGLPYDKKTLRGWIIPYNYQGYVFKEGVYLIGDAGGFTGGLLGEGISHALLSGFDVANLIADEKYQPKNIKNLLKLKRLQEAILSLGNRIPSAWAATANFMVWFARRSYTRNISVRLCNLQEIKKYKKADG